MTAWDDQLAKLIGTGLPSPTSSFDTWSQKTFGSAGYGKANLGASTFGSSGLFVPETATTAPIDFMAPYMVLSDYLPVAGSGRTIEQITDELLADQPAEPVLMCLSLLVHASYSRSASETISARWLTHLSRRWPAGYSTRCGVRCRASS